MRFWWLYVSAASVAVILHPIGSPYSASTASVVLLGALFITGTLKIASWATWCRESRRLIDDCDVEHAAILRGNDRLGVFGRYQPPGEMYAGVRRTEKDLDGSLYGEPLDDAIRNFWP